MELGRTDKKHHLFFFFSNFDKHKENEQGEVIEKNMVKTMGSDYGGCGG